MSDGFTVPPNLVRRSNMSKTAARTVSVHVVMNNAINVPRIGRVTLIMRTAESVNINRQKNATCIIQWLTLRG